MFKDDLEFLEISQSDFARMLKVNDRTVRRWVANDNPTGPVKAMTQAWIQLKRHGLSYRPDEIYLSFDKHGNIVNRDDLMWKDKIYDAN